MSHSYESVFVIHIYSTFSYRQVETCKGKFHDEKSTHCVSQRSVSQQGVFHEFCFDCVTNTVETKFVENSLLANAALTNRVETKFGENSLLANSTLTLQ